MTKYYKNKIKLTTYFIIEDILRYLFNNQFTLNKVFIYKKYSCKNVFASKIFIIDNENNKNNKCNFSKLFTPSMSDVYYR